MAGQDRAAEPEVTFKAWLIDCVTFIRASALYAEEECTSVLNEVEAGAVLFAIGLPFVDNTWQNPGETSVFAYFAAEDKELSAGRRTPGFARKIDISVDGGFGSDAFERAELATVERRE